MSLDIYLKGKVVLPVEKSTGIFIRRGGKNEEISEEEWYSLNPATHPLKLTKEEDIIEYTDVLFHANITHNLNVMAGKVHIVSDVLSLYGYLWRPSELGVITAEELIQPLTQGYLELIKYPSKYKEFDPENGWGNYDSLVSFVKDYLIACLNNPESIIEISK